MQMSKIGASCTSIQLCQTPFKRTHKGRRHKEDVRNNIGCTLLDCQNSLKLFSGETQVRAHCELEERHIFAANWAPPLVNHSNNLTGTFQVAKGSIGGVKGSNFAFPPFLISQQDFTTKEDRIENLFAAIQAWSVSREQQENAFSEKSKVFLVPQRRSKIASDQRSRDSSKLHQKQQLPMLWKAPSRGPATWIYDIFHWLFAWYWILQHPSSNVFCVPYRRDCAVLHNGGPGKSLCFYYVLIYQFLSYISFLIWQNALDAYKDLTTAINSITVQFFSSLSTQRWDTVIWKLTGLPFVITFVLSVLSKASIPCHELSPDAS